MMKTLINPFENYSERILFVVGFIGFLLVSILCYSQDIFLLGSLKVIRYHASSWGLTALNLGFTLLSNTLILFVAAWLINRKTRGIDILNTVLIAHIAIYLLCAITALPIVNSMLTMLESQVQTGSFDPTSITTKEQIILVVFSLIALNALVLFFYLIVQGTKVATNCKRSVQLVGIVALVLAWNTLLQFVNPYIFSA